MFGEKVERKLNALSEEEVDWVILFLTQPLAEKTMCT